MSQLLSVYLYESTYLLQIQFSYFSSLSYCDQFSILILTFLYDSIVLFKIKTYKMNYASNTWKDIY